MYEFEVRTNERLSEVNQELEKAKKAAEEAFHIAEEANQSKSRFLSNMSHDVQDRGRQDEADAGRRKHG